MQCFPGDVYRFFFFFFLANAVQTGIKGLGKQVLFGLFRSLERADFGSS